MPPAAPDMAAAVTDGIPADKPLSALQRAYAAAGAAAAPLVAGVSFLLGAPARPCAPQMPTRCVPAAALFVAS